MSEELPTIRWPKPPRFELEPEGVGAGSILAALAIGWLLGAVSVCVAVRLMLFS